MNAILELTWIDAESDDAWRDIDEHKSSDLARIHTIGWLLSEDERMIRLAQNIDATNGKASMVMTIPKAWIVSRKVVKRGKKVDRSN
jgi:hypothetical protein